MKWEGGWLLSLAPVHRDFSRGFPVVNPMGFSPHHPRPGGDLGAMLCELLLLQASELCHFVPTVESPGSGVCSSVWSESKGCGSLSLALC